MVGSHQSLVDSPENVPVIETFDVIFVGSPYKLLNKKLSCHWFQMPLCTCNIPIMCLQLDGIHICYKLKLFLQVNFAVKISLWSRYAISLQISWQSLVQVMVCCLYFDLFPHPEYLVPNCKWEFSNKQCSSSTPHSMFWFCFFEKKVIFSFQQLIVCWVAQSLVGHCRLS